MRVAILIDKDQVEFAVCPTSVMVRQQDSMVLLSVVDFPYDIALAMDFHVAIAEIDAALNHVDALKVTVS